MTDRTTTDLGDGLLDCTPAPDPDRRDWVAASIRKLQADANRSADTHLHVARTGTRADFYLKDESTHPTGSLKHRLARSHVLYALCNGHVGPATMLVEASSGSTAVSEAHFARMLGLPFVAVMAATTSRAKVELIEREGGRCHLVDDPGTVYDVAQRLADESGGHYLDQFTFAERATDWRGNNNIAESIFEQLALEPHPDPTWIVVGAGTGGTSATLGRFVRYRGHAARVCVADPEGSAFLPAWRGDDLAGVECRPSRIEGIGRPRPEPSFVPGVVDRMMRVPDDASVAGMHLLRERTGLRGGPSTGTSLVAALRLACEMEAAGEDGSLVALVCDRGDRYEGQPFVEEPREGVARWHARLATAWDTGRWA